MIKQLFAIASVAHFGFNAAYEEINIQLYLDAAEPVLLSKPIVTAEIDAFFSCFQREQQFHHCCNWVRLFFFLRKCNRVR